jgi:hypothetical protein
MFGKEPQLNPLESRKQLLIAESEINRAQLLEEWQTIAGELHGLASRVKSVGSLASVAALVVSGISALRQKESDAKHSWLQTSLKVAQSVGSLWLALRARQR